MKKWTLKACRINSGFTLKQVSSIIGKNLQTISRYEKDSSNIPLGLLSDLSNLYKVDINEIFLGKSTKKIEFL
ncbi:helix-turn-helix domain-containing protein [Streptococcus uberis]